MRKFWLWLLPIIFFLHENDFFGWNRLPCSPEEVLADGIVLILLAIAIKGVK